jgi:hypothetical protein
LSTCPRPRRSAHFISGFFIAHDLLGLTLCVLCLQSHLLPDELAAQHHAPRYDCWFSGTLYCGCGCSTARQGPNPGTRALSAHRHLRNEEKTKKTDLAQLYFIKVYFIKPHKAHFAQTALQVDRHRAHFEQCALRIHRHRVHKVHSCGPSQSTLVTSLECTTE